MQYFLPAAPGKSVEPGKKISVYKFFRPLPGMFVQKAATNLPGAAKLDKSKNITGAATET